MAIDSSVPGLDILSQSLGITVKDSNQSNGKVNGHSQVDSKEEQTGSNGVHEDVAEEEAGVGSIIDVHTIYHVKDKDEEWIWTSKEPEDVVEPAENDETAKFAVVLRTKKSGDSRKKFQAHSIVVQSPQLKQVLGLVLKDYPGISCDLERLVFEAPFKPFMHRWSDLQEYLRQDLDSTSKAHLNLLNKILQEELKDDIKAYQDYLSKGVTTFTHAWMMFQPGGLIVSESTGPLSVYELVDAAYITTNSGCTFLQLETNVIEWSGSEFGRYKTYLNIPEFKGVEKITELLAFPLPFYEDRENLKAMLIERGRKFEALAGHHFRSYNGTAIDWDNEGREVGVHHSGRIVVDCKSFNRYSPHPARRTKDFSDKDKKQLVRKAPEARSRNVLKRGGAKDEGSAYHLSDYFRMLCYSRVRGYSLSQKKWLDFFIPYVQDIEWNSRAFDSLVLPEDQKELILAFTESQVDNREGFDDMIQGKGQGIIILLSGKPGIGKTLTAESVAEAMKRPLHTISSGDLGSSAWDVEYKLQRLLDLVGRWNAVLLLDECDVFLEARSTHDLTRNAMVSTFLRTLEYYTGILFLTTNRADNIDPAFESRIHVSLQYPDLTAESRKRIWTNFLSGQQHNLTGSDMDELAQLDLNGRQIKNILKTSHLLASWKKRNLCMKDVSTVLDIENRRPERKIEWESPQSR